MAITALHTAATGMQALSTKIDVIANNIANADTVGFKASRVNFEDVAYHVMQQPGVQTSDDTMSPLGKQLGLGVNVANTQVMFSQGSPLQTGRGLDAMIQGDGFFQVELPNGETGYTRAGNFVLNAKGELVLANSPGHRLKDAPQISGDDVVGNTIAVSSNGEITWSTNDGQQQTEGPLVLARFLNPDGLIQNGANIFRESAASGAPITDEPGKSGIGNLVPATLELSNTEAVTELVELIKTQRVFQMNSQSIQSADEALQVVANMRR